jgi:hypothetical protein
LPVIVRSMRVRAPRGHLTSAGESAGNPLDAHHTQGFNGSCRSHLDR